MPKLISSENKQRIGRYYLDKIVDQEGNQFIYPRTIEEATILKSKIIGTEVYYDSRPGAVKCNVTYISLFDELAEKNSEYIDNMENTIDTSYQNIPTSFTSYLRLLKSIAEEKEEKPKKKNSK